MRLLPGFLLVAFLLAAVPASAQPPSFPQAYQVRAAVGDIPTTAAHEGAGWNIDQQYTFTFANATPRDVTVVVPAGTTTTNASCTCGAGAQVSAGSVTFHLPSSTSSGSYKVEVLSSEPTAAATAFQLVRPDGPGDGVVILYVPNGSTADAPLDAQSPGSSTDGLSRILVYSGAPLPQPFWASIHPTTSAPAPGKSAAPALSWPIALAIGVVLGVLLWALLVSKGAVQRKGRRQVAGTAAHVEAAASETPAVLEGKKRALLAALKEVEVAKMNNEMPPEVYDVVKADLKKQAVTVMRALESGADAAAAE
jgi:hypothetical protein